MNKNKKLALIIGISIPALIILFLIISIYLQKSFVQPSIDFLYISADDYDKLFRYNVQKQRLVKVKNEQKINYYPYHFPHRETKLYVYDVKINKAKEISMQEAKLLLLDTASKSPDGFSIVCVKREEFPLTFFLGAINDCSIRYLTGSGKNQALNLRLNALAANYNFRFLGWIKQ